MEVTKETTKFMVRKIRDVKGVAYKSNKYILF